MSQQATHLERMLRQLPTRKFVVTAFAIGFSLISVVVLFADRIRAIF